MVDFSVPGTDEDVSTSDPTGAVWTVIGLIGGAAILFMALPIGQQIASWINDGLSGLVGTDVGDAEVIGTGGGGL